MDYDLLNLTFLNVTHSNISKYYNTKSILYKNQSLVFLALTIHIINEKNENKTLCIALVTPFINQATPKAAALMDEEE